MTSRRFERGVWALLVAAMLGVVGVYTRQRLQSHDRLPVLGTITPFSLTNQFGVAVNREALEGYVLIGDIIFSRCPTQCHRMTQLLRRVQERLPKGAPFRIVSLTADPSHDTPEVLNRYGERYGYEPATWIFLTGAKADVYRLAIEGFLLAVEENRSGAAVRLEEMFLHSSAFVVVDRQGRLRGVVHLEEAEAEERLLNLVNAVLELPRN